MGKRHLRLSVYASLEGEKTETALFDVLTDLYHDPATTNIEFNPQPGGNPDELIGRAMDNQCRARSFAWIDEDRPIRDRTREKLSRLWQIKPPEKASFMQCALSQLQSEFNPTLRKPVIIVSTPVCADGLLIKLMGYTPAHDIFSEECRERQIRELKSSVSGIIGRQKLSEYLRQRLTRQKIEEARLQYPQIDLLVKMITG